MKKQDELKHMRDSLRNSRIIKGMAMTKARERMLERDLTVVRLVGGYKGAKPAEVEQSHLLPDRFSSREVPYRPTGSKKAVPSFAVDIPGTRNYLLPEALGSDGYIHVASEDGMNIGILIARAKSPILDQPEHTTRAVSLDYDSEVNGRPLVYSERKLLTDGSRGNGLNEKPEALVICGEGTFLDLLLGRMRMKDETMTGVTEILSDKSKGYTGKADLRLVFLGEALPEEEDIPIEGPKRPRIATRGLSLGETVDTQYDLGSRDFKASPYAHDRYELKFVFD